MHMRMRAYVRTCVRNALAFARLNAYANRMRAYERACACIRICERMLAYASACAIASAYALASAQAQGRVFMVLYFTRTSLVDEVKIK